MNSTTIMPKTTHVCIIGDDPIANLTPIVDKSIPSDHVVLAYLPAHKHSFNAVAGVAKSRGYKVSEWPLPETLNTSELSFSFQALFDQYSHSEDCLWFNASNGTRHQVLAAYEVARAYQVDIYIVEPTLDKLCWLTPHDKPPLNINDKLTIKEFMLLYGCQVTSKTNQSLHSEYEALATEWTSRVMELQPALSKLNRLAHTAQGEDFTSTPQSKDMLNNAPLQQMLHGLQHAKLVNISQRKVSFLNPSTHFFANGGWLEYMVFAQLRALRTSILPLQDVAHGVKVLRKIDGERVMNELDILALCNNKLHIIEVKTQRFSPGEAAKTLYKLASISERLGNAKSRSMLVSYYPLKPNELARAKDLNIAIIDGGQLRFLRSTLHTWLQQA